MDRLHPKLFVGQLDDQTHDGVVARIDDAGGAPFLAVHDRGFESMVTVGEHHRFLGNEFSDLGDVVGCSDGPEFVDDTVFIGRAGQRHCSRRDVAEARCGGEPPDRIEVHTGRAQQGETVALRLRECPLVGKDVALAGRARE